MPNKSLNALSGSSKPRATALDSGMPPPSMSVPQDQGAQQGQPPQQPAPSHAQTVAALRHFQIFMEMEKGWLNNPELGKSDFKDQFIEAYTKLVADRIATPVQAIGSLAQVPERPFQQRQWVQDAYNKNVQARDIVLAHHAQAFAGQPPQQTPDADNHLSDIQSMMTSHYGGGSQQS